MAKIKMALCVPTHGHVHAKWTQCITKMIAHFLQSKLTDGAGEDYEKEVEAFFVSSSMLTESRHRLTAEAALWGADYLLWMDSDHVFPADALCRLWARNVDIVGVNYARRSHPTAPTAAKHVTDDSQEDHRNLVYTTQAKYEAAELEEVSHLGFGLCLFRMSIFDRLQEKAEADGEQSFMPLYMFEPKPDGMGLIGEDVYFFRKCRDAGIRIYCDHGVSGEIGHLHECVITNADAVAEEAAWRTQSGDFGKRLADRADELDRAA